jgi:DNA-binding MarR family transcriptional regulator
MNPTSITIELTGPQIDRVIRASGEGPDIASMLRGLAGDETLIGRYEALAESPRLSRSLLLGLLVLASFPPDGGSLSVSDIAGRLGMSPSTTHRYLSTLLAVGLLEQDPRTRRYQVTPDS